MVPFRVSFAVRTWPQSYHWLFFVLLFVELSASMVSSHCKHDVDALLWLNALRVPTSSLADLWDVPPMAALSRLWEFHYYNNIPLWACVIPHLLQKKEGLATLQLMHCHQRMPLLISVVSCQNVGICWTHCDTPWSSIWLVMATFCHGSDS